MSVEIRQVPAMRLVGVRHVGPYWEIGEAFARLGAWVQQAGLPCGAMIGVYHDDPREVPVEQLRSDACLEIGPDAVIDDPAVSVVELPAGDCAYLRHVGPYSGLPAAWDELIAGLAATGRTVRHACSFEIYVNDCTQVPPEEVITDLYQPVEPA